MNSKSSEDSECAFDMLSLDLCLLGFQENTPHKPGGISAEDLQSEDGLMQEQNSLGSYGGSS